MDTQKRPPRNKPISFWFSCSSSFSHCQDQTFCKIHGFQCLLPLSLSAISSQELLTVSPYRSCSDPRWQVNVSQRMVFSFGEFALRQQICVDWRSSIRNCPNTAGKYTSYGQFKLCGTEVSRGVAQELRHVVVCCPGATTVACTMWLGDVIWSVSHLFLLWRQGCTLTSSIHTLRSYFFIATFLIWRTKHMFVSLQFHLWLWCKYKLYSPMWIADSSSSWRVSWSEWPSYVPSTHPGLTCSNWLSWSEGHKSEFWSVWSYKPDFGVCRKEAHQFG